MSDAGRIRLPGPWAGFPLVMEHDILGAKEVISCDRDTQALRLFGFIGHDKAGEPLAKLVVDLPERRFHHVRLSANAKIDQELHDVLAFLEVDHPGQQIKAHDLVPGDDPNTAPDVIVRSGDLKFSVETTQLLVPGTSSGRNVLSKWSLFEQVNGWLVDQSNRMASRLRAHRGHVVYLWFTDGLSAMQQLPPRNIGGAIAEFLAANPPDSTPPDRTLKSQDGRIQATWLPVRPSRAPSAFERLYKFRLGVSYDQILTRKGFRNEVQRLIQKHDCPGFDVLLLTIGTPTRAGWHFPSAGLLSAALQAEPDVLAGYKPEHVCRIAVYDAHQKTARWVLGGAP